MNELRIAITGAQGSGKSTLAKDLVKSFLPNVRLLAGIGSRVRDLGYPLGELATEDTYFAFAAEHLARERHVDAKLVIQDRCLLDLLAYARVLENIRPSSMRLIEECAKSSFIRIGATFLTSLIDVVQGRGETEEFRRRIEVEILAVARDLEVPLIRITGNREVRLRLARLHLQGILGGEEPLSST